VTHAALFLYRQTPEYSTYILICAFESGFALVRIWLDYLF
jgi:hypothetical protein